jgi:ethanolamine utilization protein EutA
MNNYSKTFSPKDKVKMIGLDFGSTTSSAMVAVAGVGLNSVTGRMAFGTPRVVYRSDTIFTPFKGEMIDEHSLKETLENWLHQCKITGDDLFSGGVIITGLAARQRNSEAIARLVEKRVGQAIIATADDPNLESWLAFMGCASTLSRHHPELSIINLDIGGGTTNPAMGQAGQVSETGCFFVGARHFQFKPGSYLLKHVSFYGQKLLKHLSISKKSGAVLDPPELDAILDFYIAALEAIVSGDTSFFLAPIAALHQQTPFMIKPKQAQRAITFSGGVGELIYQIAQEKDVPGTTYYGDLGIDLALRIVASPVLSTHIKTLQPENMGRATVYGLTLHNTEISGSTTFLPHPERLPLKDIPIVARLRINGDRDEVAQALLLAAKHPKGACIQIIPQGTNKGSNNENQVLNAPESEPLARIKGLGMSLARGLEKLPFSPEIPLIILVPGNYGKALGNYATNWQQSRSNLIVIDEIPDRNAHFVNIGRLHRNIVPVSFYGVH